MFGLYIVAGMVFVGAVVLVVFYHQKSLKMTSNTTAQVVKVEQREVRDEKERRDETLVVVRYQVNDKEYRIEQLLRGRQAVLSRGPFAARCFTTRRSRKCRGLISNNRDVWFPKNPIFDCRSLIFERHSTQTFSQRFRNQIREQIRCIL